MDKFIGNTLEYQHISAMFKEVVEKKIKDLVGITDDEAKSDKTLHTLENKHCLRYYYDAAERKV